MINKTIVLFLKNFYFDSSIVLLKIGGCQCGLAMCVVKSCTEENTWNDIIDKYVYFYRFP